MANRVLLGFMVVVRVDEGTTVNVVVAVALRVRFGVNTAVAMGLGGMVLLYITPIVVWSTAVL